ncbi:MAG: twin-arginine translocase TatA/TatE family subunit [Capnocytophaga sp.]|nr:twin-arginine translocase TatA/TatE family subunit [Capnocytophaga sp.]
MLAQSVFLGVIGGWQVVVIVVLALLFFGGKKIPELMRGLGGGIREFKGAMREDEKPETAEEEKKLRDKNE